MPEFVLTAASGLGPERTIKPNPAGIQGSEGVCLLGGIRAPFPVLPLTSCVTDRDALLLRDSVSFSYQMEMELSEKR